jgi:hypothetical protein
MWRREEELGYWLSGGHPSQKPDPASGLIKRLPRKLGLLQFHNIVKEQPLCLEAIVIGFGDDLPVKAEVYDGFGSIDQWKYSQEGTVGCEQPDTIHNAELLSAAAVRSLRLPDERQVRVRQIQTNFKTNARAIPMKLAIADVHSLECFKKQSLSVKDGERMLMMNPEIKDLKSGISSLPHMRRSLDIDGLQDIERQSFLREAEAIKKVPVERAELVAVFRHVPIDAVSRLHFLADKRIILYSISGAPKRSRTRVHDMAAVRDTSNQEIHLVPHRTRFRLVSLN